MINIKSVQELEGELYIGDYGGYFCDYADTNEYISDIITEIADNNVSIYYSDILKFVSENPDSLNEVIESGLYDPTCNYDFYSHAADALGKCDAARQFEIYDNQPFGRNLYDGSVLYDI